jgi:hypothetical protein
MNEKFQRCERHVRVREPQDLQSLVSERATRARIPRMMPTHAARKRYDWKACAISLVAAFAVAVPAALLVTRIVGSMMFLVVIVTLVGTGVSRWTYARVAKPGSRPIDDEPASC